MIHSYTTSGFEGLLVAIEVCLRGGIPKTEIIGLPDNAVKEARERVRAAMRACQFDYPGGLVLVNLAPGNEKKFGTTFDLAIASAILLASQQIEACRYPLIVLGELELSGRVRPVTGVISVIAGSIQQQIAHFIVPQHNWQEAASLQLGRIYPLQHLRELPQLIREINRDQPPPPHAPESMTPQNLEGRDFADLLAMPLLKRALEIAVAGRHHALLFGPPGCGKTMAISSLPSILPPLSPQESIEVTRIWSQAGLLSGGIVAYPPLRSPHHSASPEGMIGGGSQLLPGEVSLAHHGLLFLDEAPEFRSHLLQGLREPLESQRVTLARAGRNYWYPADFQLIMAANPCPCGNLGRDSGICTCSQREIQRYWKQLGGALLDRIDMRIPVVPTPVEQLLSPQEEPSKNVRERVLDCRQRQKHRYQDLPFSCNSRLPAGQLRNFCSLSAEAEALFTKAVNRLRLSSRASHSALRLARTIADLAGKDQLSMEHIAEAVQHRRYGDRDIYWQEG